MGTAGSNSSISTLLNVHERPANTTPSAIGSFLDTLVASSDSLYQTLRQLQQEQLSVPPDQQSDDILQQLVSEAFPSRLHAFLQSLMWAADQQPRDVRVTKTLQNVLQSLKFLLQPPSEYDVEEIFCSSAGPSALAQPQQPQPQQQLQQQQQQRSQKRTDAHALSAQAFSAELVCTHTLTALVSLAFNKLGLAEGEEDPGPASLVHDVATEALDACIDASGGVAMSQHIDQRIAQGLTQAAGGVEQAHRLLQCVRAAERRAAAEQQQQQQQQQPLDDSFEPATAAVLNAVASGLDSQGHAAMQALLQAQPSLVFWRLCLRAYACLQGVCIDDSSRR